MSRERIFGAQKLVHRDQSWLHKIFSNNAVEHLLPRFLNLLHKLLLTDTHVLVSIAMTSKIFKSSTETGRFDAATRKHARAHAILLSICLHTNLIQRKLLFLFLCEQDLTPQQSVKGRLTVLIFFIEKAGATPLRAVCQSGSLVSRVKMPGPVKVC